MTRVWIAEILFVFILVGCGNATTPGSTPPATPAATDVTVQQPGPTLTTAATAVPATAAAVPTTSGATPARNPTASAPAPDPSNSPSAAATRVVPPAGSINLPPGFGISIFASGLNNPRNIVIGPDGQLYVADRGSGRILRLPDRNHDGVADGVEVIASGLGDVSSLAFYKDGSLYVSNASQVMRLSQPDANGAFQKTDVVISGLPGHVGHFTRTLRFSPDWSSLFIQIGSSCNVCVESDSRRATIMRFNPDGSGGQIYARGLRNAVGLTFRPGTNELWVTNNGTDNLGDNQPPDTIALVQQGQDYGWPHCHAGTIVDPQFGGPGACNGVAKPMVDLQAHSAVLGLTFYTGTQFPQDYNGDLFVAMHGSIYRSVPTGYKVVRIHFNNGQPGAAQDFATGWLPQGGREWGRPTDVVTAPDGSLFVSDDTGDVIYRIFYTGS